MYPLYVKLTEEQGRMFEEICRSDPRFVAFRGFAKKAAVVDLILERYKKLQKKQQKEAS